MLEQLIGLKKSIRNKESKLEVKKKFIEYTNAYDEGERDVIDKIKHREIALEYFKYMGRNNE